MESQPISFQIEAFSQTKVRNLQLQTSEIEGNITSIAKYLKEDLSTKIHDQKSLVLKSFEAYDDEIRKKLGKDLLSLFTTLKENVSGEKPIDSFDFGNWILETIRQLEDKTGKLHIDDIEVVNIVNDVSSSWNQKIEELKQSIRDSYKDTVKQEETRPSTAETETSRKQQAMKHDDTPSMDKSDLGGKKGGNETGLIGKFKGILFKKEETGEKATEINLGNEKNFKWDPVKKRYIFDDEPDVPEEDDNAPPPTKAQTQSAKVEEKKEEGPKSGEQPDKLAAADLLKPPSVHIKRKKGQHAKSEMAAPSFNPMMFVPKSEPTVAEVVKSQVESIPEKGGDIFKNYIERIESIFNGNDFDFTAVERFKSLVLNFNKAFSKEVDERIKDYSELLLLKGEWEATETFAVNLQIKSRVSENESGKLKSLLDHALQKEIQLAEELKRCNSEINFYKELLKSRSEILKISNSSDNQMALIETNYNNQNENIELRRQIRDLTSKIFELKSSYEEAKMNLNAMTQKYNQSFEQINREKENSKAIQEKLKNVYLQNKYKDDTIISLKRANLDSLVAYKNITSEFNYIKEQTENLEKEMGRKNESLAYLEKELDKKEKKIIENSKIASEKENELDKYAKELHRAAEDKKSLEQKLNIETQRHQELKWNIQAEKKHFEDTIETLHKQRTLDLKFIHELKQSIFDNEIQKEELKVEINRKNQDIIDFKQNLSQVINGISENIKALSSENIDQLSYRLSNLDSDSSILLDISSDFKNMFSKMEESIRLKTNGLVVEHKKMVVEKNVLNDRLKVLNGELLSTRQKAELLLSLNESYKEKCRDLSVRVEELLRRESSYLQKLEGECSKITSLEKNLHTKNLELIAAKNSKIPVEEDFKVNTGESVRLLNEEILAELENLQQLNLENTSYIESLKLDLQEAQINAQRSEEKASNLAHVNTNLEQELLNSINQISQLENDLSEANKLISGLKENNTQLVHKTSELTTSLKNAEDHHIVTKNHLEQSNQKLQALESEISTLKDEIKSLTEQKVELEGQLDEGFTQYNQLSSELEVIKEKGNQVLVEKKQIFDSLKAAEEEIKILKSNGTQNEEISKEFERLHNDLKHNEDLVSNLKNEIKTSQENLDEANKLVQTLKAEIEEKNKRLGEIEDQLESAKESLNLAQNKNENSQTETSVHINERNELKEKLEKVEKEKSELIVQKESLESEVNSLKEDLSTMNNNYSELEKRVQEKLKEERTLREELENRGKLSVEKQIVLSSSTELTEILQNLVEEYQGTSISQILSSLLEQSKEGDSSSLPSFLPGLLRKVEDNIQAYEKEIEERISENKSLKESIDESNSQIEKLRNSLALFESKEDQNDEYKSLKELYEKKVKRLEELTAENITKNSKIEELQKLISESEKNSSKTLQVDSKEAKSRIEELQKELEAQKQEKKKLSDEFLAHQKKYQNYEEEKGTQMQSHKDIIKRLSNEIENLERLKTPSKPKVDIKSTQFPENAEIREEKSPEKPGDPKKSSSFLMGVAKLFLTESDIKNI